MSGSLAHNCNCDGRPLIAVIVVLTCAGSVPADAADDRSVFTIDGAGTGGRLLTVMIGRQLILGATSAKISVERREDRTKHTHACVFVCVFVIHIVLPS